MEHRYLGILGVLFGGKTNAYIYRIYGLYFLTIKVEMYIVKLEILYICGLYLSVCRIKPFFSLLVAIVILGKCITYGLNY